MTSRPARRVVFDGAILADGPPTGVARAFLVALEAYAARPERRTLLLLPSGTARPETLSEQVPTVEVPAPALRGLGRSRHLPRLLRLLHAAIWHSPVAALPWRAPCPMVATVHDLPWRVRPRLDETGCGWRHRLALQLALRRAARVIVPSEYTAAAVRADSPRHATRVVVIPHGLPEIAEPAPLEGRDGPLLAFADHRPRKNLDRLRRCHALARERAPDLPELRVLGPGIDWVDDDTKAALLRSSRALLVPSRHEGFGLPLVEAFGHGLPVACANRASLPEVAGGAALLFDPDDEQDFAAALIAIHRDATLRERLAVAGRVRAAELTAERTATAWAQLHDAVLGCD